MVLGGVGHQSVHASTPNYPHDFKKKIDGLIYKRLCPSVRQSVRPPRYLLLNHWAEFYQTCYITLPHGTGVCEQNNFPCARPSARPCVHLSVRHALILNHWAKINQTCYITSPHGKGVREQHYFFSCARPSVRTSVVSLSVRTAISSKPLSGIQPNLLQHLPSR